MRRFSLKTHFLAFTIAALLTAFLVTRFELNRESAQLRALKMEFRALDVSDDTKINALSIPAFGSQSWRWRLHLPPDREFRFGLSFDNVCPDATPNETLNYLEFGDRFAGETIFTANIGGGPGNWTLLLHSQAPGRCDYDFEFEIDGKNTKWLAEEFGCFTNIAGDGFTESSTTNEGMILLSYCDGLRSPGRSKKNPAPTDGVQIWIEECEPGR